MFYSNSDKRQASQRLDNLKGEFAHYIDLLKYEESKQIQDRNSIENLQNKIDSLAQEIGDIESEIFAFNVISNFA